MTFWQLLSTFGGIFKILWKYYQTTFHFMRKKEYKSPYQYTLFSSVRVKDKRKPMVTLTSLSLTLMLATNQSQYIDLLVVKC